MDTTDASTSGAASVDEFSAPDMVMEPTIFVKLINFFQGGGAPEQCIERLSANYHCTAQLCNLLADWLGDLEMRPENVKDIFEEHLLQMLQDRFEPAKADRLFEEDNEIGIGECVIRHHRHSHPDWLPDLISQPRWRRLLYQLAHAHPDCLLLSFGVKLCSDAGYDNEITSVRTAVHQIDIYARVLSARVRTVLRAASRGAGFARRAQQALNELTEIAVYNECTYIYVQTVLTIIAARTPGAVQDALEYLSNEIRRRGKPERANQIHVTLLNVRQLMALVEQGDGGTANEAVLAKFAGLPRFFCHFCRKRVATQSRPTGTADDDHQTIAEPGRCEHAV